MGPFCYTTKLRIREDRDAFQTMVARGRKRVVAPTAILLVLCSMQAFAQVPLLDRIISLQKKNTTLYDALSIISRTSGCMFIYNSETIDNGKRVKIPEGDHPLGKVLDGLLKNPGLTYRVLGNHILICRAETDTPVPEAVPSGSQRGLMHYIVVRGHVYDNENRTVLPFATVGIPALNIGTITNNDGFFLLKVPDSLEHTSLQVSYMGYSNKHIPLALLTGQEVDIYLNRRIIPIQEVIVRYINPEMIVEQALERLKLNYATDPVYLTTFYREGVKKNNRFTSYSEALFKVYKAPVDEGSDQVKLLKSRRVVDEAANDTVFLKLKAGVAAALQLDIVKNLPDFLDQTLPMEYTYRYANLVSRDSCEAYAVGFEQHNSVKRALYRGTLYIARTDFAILGVDFEINPDYIDGSTSRFILKKSPGLKVKLNKINYLVSYSRFNGRYYLKHVRCDLSLSTRQRHHITTNQFSTFLELATIAIDTAGVVQIPRQELFPPGKVFSEQPYFKDDNFWGETNTIAPEINLQEALIRLSRSLEQVH